MKHGSPHVMFSGGGTGGHLFPGLAVATSLRKLEPTVRISFVGSGRAWERRLVTEAGYFYQAIACRPFRLRPDRLATFIAVHVRGVALARRLIAREQPDVVVGLGGFASVPLARAARQARVPLVLLEQNSVRGKANGWLARHAKLVCVAFDDARAALAHEDARVLVTGNPIRIGFQFNHRGRSNADTSRQLLVLGGSGGSRQLNTAVPQILARVGPSLAGWRIVHQTGAAELVSATENYRKLGIAAAVTDFIHDMPAVLGASDLVVSRAGGTTLAELAAAGVPAILCPLATAAHDHQRCNGLAFARAGACELWQPELLDMPEQHVELAAQLAELLADERRRARMSRAMQSLARPDAADRVAGEILTLIASQMPAASTLTCSH